MYGLPEPPIIDEGKEEKLVASVSVSLEPPEGTGGPFISVSYEISLRVFCIALALSRLEKKEKPKDKSDIKNDDEKTKTEYQPEGKQEKDTDVKSSDIEKSGDNAAPRDDNA